MKQILLGFRDHTVYVPFLRPDSVVVDLGANVGEFSQQIVDRFGCRAYAVEPHPELFRRIPEQPRIKKLNVCITEHKGTVPFYIARHPEGSSVYPFLTQMQRTISVQGLPWHQLKKRIGAGIVDLLKVDIEGAEIPLLDSMSEVALGNIKQISVEFHDFLQDHIRARDVHRIQRRLEKSGFVSINVNGGGDHMDMLFVNKKFLTVREYLDILFFKYVRLRVRQFMKRFKKGKTGQPASRPQKEDGGPLFFHISCWQFPLKEKFLRAKWNLIKKAVDSVMDFQLGIHTSQRQATLRETGHFGDRVGYAPTPYPEIIKMLECLDLDASDVFVDFGCGSGRVVLLAATRPLKKVIGIELDDDLIKSARWNLKSLRLRKAPVQLNHSDAVDCDLDEGTVFYFCNPFGSKTMQRILQNIREGLTTHPRDIRLVYRNPVARMIFDEADWLTPQGWIDNTEMYVWRNKEGHS